MDYTSTEMSKVMMAEQPWADPTEGRAACASAAWDESVLIAKADIAESTDADRNRHSLVEPAGEPQRKSPATRPASEDPVTKDKNASRRFGLPAGFVSCLGRYGRSVLFEDNVYRLPNGLEFIPQPPEGTLGSRNHQYALLTTEQYLKRQRGSVYVRTDGRIFDYAYDHNQPEREMFDSGFTIQDLERTGRYAPALKSRSFGLRKRRKKPRARRR